MIALSAGDVFVRVLGYAALVLALLLVLHVGLYALRFPPSVRLVERLRARGTRKHQRAARELGMDYTTDDVGLVDLPLSLMSWGMRRWVKHVISGTYRGRDAWLFQLYYQVPGGKYGPSLVTRRAAVARIDAAFPHIVIEHRGLMEMAQPLHGVEEMHFDAEFDEAYRVRSTDPELAADILDANVRRWMLGLDRRWRFEISGPWVLAYEHGGTNADDRGLLDMVSDLADRVPWILLQQHPAGSAPDPDPLRVGSPTPPERPRRRGSTLAFIAWTALVLVAAGILVPFAADWDRKHGVCPRPPTINPCDTPTVSIPPPSIALPSFEPPSIAVPSIVVPTEPPAPTPTVTATRGTPIALAGIRRGEEVTVTFRDLLPIPHPTVASGASSPSRTRLGAEFLIENTGAVRYVDFPANGITLLDDAGHAFHPSLTDSFQPGFGTVRLDPGERARGFVTFEIPVSAHPAAVLFRTDSNFGPQTGRWRP